MKYLYSQKKREFDERCRTREKLWFPAVIFLPKKQQSGNTQNNVQLTVITIRKKNRTFKTPFIRFGLISIRYATKSIKSSLFPLFFYRNARRKRHCKI